MKRFVLIISCIFLIASFSACKKRDDSPVVSDDAQVSPSLLPSPSPEIPEPSATPSLAVSNTPKPVVSVKDSVFELNNDKSNISIDYPVLTGLSPEAGEAANSALNSLAFAEYSEEFAANGLELTVDYSIGSMTDSRLSVIFSEHGYYAGSPHDFRIINGITIDLETGKRIRLRDIIPLENIKDALDNNEFILVDGLEDAFIEPLLYETWFDQFDRGGEEPHYADYYIKGESLFLIFEVNHAVGDYLIVSCPLKTLGVTDY